MTLSHRLRVAASLESAYDAPHSEFFSSSASPLDFDNSSYDEFSSSGTSGLSGNTHDAYGSAFFDNYNQKIFGNNNYTNAVDPWIWDWSNGGSSYTGNANFYAVSSNGSAFANLDNANNSDTSGDPHPGGFTVGYLGDQTPVLVAAGSSSNRRFYFFEYSSGNFIGKCNITIGGTNGPESASMHQAKIAFTGTHIITMRRGTHSNGNAYLYGFPMPASTSNISTASSNDMTANLRWTMGYDGNFHGLAWTGDGVIMGTNGNRQTAEYRRLTNNGMNGTSTLIRSFAYGENLWSLGIDYENRKLILGGYNGDKYRVFGE